MGSQEVEYRGDLIIRVGDRVVKVDDSRSSGAIRMGSNPIPRNLVWVAEW